MHIKKTVTFTNEEYLLVLDYIRKWIDKERYPDILDRYMNVREFEVVQVRENNELQDGIEIRWGDKQWNYSLFSLAAIRHHILFKGKTYKVT